MNDRPGSSPEAAGWGTGSHVLYVMERSQRAHQNAALEHAILAANRAGSPLVVLAVGSDHAPHRTHRNLQFWWEGLHDVSASLQARHIPFEVDVGDPAQVAARWAQDAGQVVVDRGYLEPDRRWRKELAEEARVSVVQVEADAVVPTEQASQKTEFAARTLRPKLHRCLSEHFGALRTRPLDVTDAKNLPRGIRWQDRDRLLSDLGADPTVAPVSEHHPGGTRHAQRRFSGFLQRKLRNYSADRNRPERNGTSELSMYLRYGQISPQWMLFSAFQSDVPSAEAEAFLEELVVRRELSRNYVLHEARYDRFDGLPSWALQTLRAHREDPRPIRYTPKQLEDAATHDRPWNAAMNQMKFTGTMHNYMRMYWGKKILEWTSDPAKAFRIVLHLNNRYFLDGNDPNSFANVAWIFGRHDRPWQERPIYGKVRYMSHSGLERKGDPDAYARQVERLIDTSAAH